MFGSLQGRHIHGEAVLKVGIYHSLVCLVYLLDWDHFDIGRDVVPAVEKDLDQHGTFSGIASLDREWPATMSPLRHNRLLLCTYMVPPVTYLLYWISVLLVFIPKLFQVELFHILSMNLFATYL